MHFFQVLLMWKIGKWLNKCFKVIFVTEIEKCGKKYKIEGAFSVCIYYLC